MIINCFGNCFNGERRGGVGEVDEGKKEKVRELFRTQIQDKVEITFY